MTKWRYITDAEKAEISKAPDPKPWVQNYPDEYIKRHARAYCINLGLDPDEQVQVDFDRYMLVGEFQGGAVCGAPRFRWEMYRADAQRALAMRDALAEIAKEDDMDDHT